MIYVSKSQLKQVEYLIGQSIQGNHVLFDLESLRRVFWDGDILLNSDVTTAESYQVEHHIERLILEPTLEAKRAYLEAMDTDTYIRVVKTYFNIVENNLIESGEVVH